MITNNPLLILTPLFQYDYDNDCVSTKAAILSPGQRDSDIDKDCLSGETFTVNQILETCQNFSHVAGTYTVNLPHNFYLVFSPFAPTGPSVLNQAAWERWQTFNIPQPLTQEADRILANQMLIYPPNQQPCLITRQSETLTVWLHITNACNLDCPYCYVHKSSAQMTEKIGLQAIEAVFRVARKHRFRHIKIKYAGGEATLHFKLIRLLHQYALKLATTTGIGLKEVVLSNGVWLRLQDGQWLVENGIKLTVSLDGVGELHNRLRPQRNGRDTFHKVENTIDHILLPLGLLPDINMTLTTTNAHGAADVAKWALIDRGLPTSFNFYRKNILSASRKDLDLQEQAIINGMLAAYEVIESHLPVTPFFDGLLDRVQAEAHSHTCGIGQSYIVVTHTGRLAQCQMHLDSPVGSSLNGDLLPMVAHGPIKNISVDEKEGCRECEFRYRCTGGCPLETYRVTGRWDVQSPNCRIYKTLFPLALRLEGLRLMKVHGYLN